MGLLETLSLSNIAFRPCLQGYYSGAIPNFNYWTIGILKTGKIESRFFTNNDERDIRMISLRNVELLKNMYIVNIYICLYLSIF